MQLDALSDNLRTVRKGADGMSAIDEYILTGSPEESNWRSVILFGRNAASYKFALAQALIDLAKQDKDSVTLDQLVDPYTRHLCEHLAHSPKQSTSRSSKFIDACSGFNNGEVTHDALISTAVQLGFNNVLDAFHVVNQGDVPVKFFEKDFSRGSRRLILTDEVFKLANSDEAGNIVQETESRWNLVETAWGRASRRACCASRMMTSARRSWPSPARGERT